MQLGPHVKTLTDFANSHLDGSDDDQFITLKLEHSLKVLQNAELILAGENMAGDEADLCRLAALYHDIGRFPQFKKYKTFIDQESVNHARLGVLTLRSLPLPGALPASHLKIVRLAVALHNAKTIRPTVPAALITPVMVVRDADKLDIFRVILEHLANDPPPNSAVTHGLVNEPGKYSEAVYQSVMNAGMCDYRDMRYVNDFKLLLISWLYSMRYATSLGLAKTRSYPEQIFSLLPDDDRIRQLRKTIFSLLHYKDSHPS
jgi:putative nucleotidyltransferase with HDIG domain